MYDSARPRTPRATTNDSATIPCITAGTPRPTRRVKQVVTGVILAVAAITALPAASVEHTVSSGEALSSIAAQYDVSVAELAAANDIDDPDVIFAGQTLRVPVVPAVADGYTVSVGDSLWAIAVRLDVSLAELMAVNDLDGDSVIVPDQVLVVPGSATAAADADQTSALHIVEPGDSLWKIAVDHGVTLSALLEANGLAASVVIVPGQEIVFPDHVEAEPEPSPLVIPDNIPAELAADPDKLALMPIFDRWAAEYDVPPDLVKAVAWFESGWNNEVVSSAGARGIGQVLPITGEWVAAEMIGLPLDLGVPDDNIRISARYLRYLLDRTGDVRMAVASYYQGLTATRQHGIYQSSQFYVDGIIALRERFD